MDKWANGCWDFLLQLPLELSPVVKCLTCLFFLLLMCIKIQHGTNPVNAFIRAFALLLVSVFPLRSIVDSHILWQVVALLYAQFPWIEHDWSPWPILMCQNIQAWSMKCCHLDMFSITSSLSCLDMHASLLQQISSLYIFMLHSGKLYSILTISSFFW